MPVTFNTDLRDLKDFGYVQQVPLEAMFKNMGYKQAKYDASAQQLQQNANSLLVNAYGQDIEKRNQIINQVNQQLQQFSSMDLSDPKVQNQINGFISQVGSSPDLAGIKMRADAYDRLQTKKQKLLADGKGTISPWNDGTTDMEDYYAGNQAYNPHKRFSGDVRLDADLSGFSKKVADSTPELEQMVKEGRYDVLSKGKVHGQLQSNFLSDLENDQNIKREYYGRFKSQYRPDHSFANDDVAAEQEHQNKLYSIISGYRTLAETEQAKLKPDPSLLSTYQQKAADAQKELNLSLAHADNINEASSEQAAWEKYKQQEAQKFADGHVSYAVKSIAPDKFDEMAQGLANDLAKISATGDKDIKVAQAKGQVPNNLDKDQSFAIFEDFKKVKKGDYDTQGEATGRIFGTNTKGTWEPDDFKRTYDIKSGINGQWAPVKNLAFFNDLFGVKATSTYTNDDGNVTKTGGKQVKGVFRNEAGEIMLILNEDGSNTAVPITDNMMKDAVAQRNKGKNYSTYLKDIMNYDLNPDAQAAQPKTTPKTNPLKLENYVTANGDTIQAYTGSSLADTVHLKTGEKIYINGTLYEK